MPANVVQATPEVPLERAVGQAPFQSILTVPAVLEHGTYSWIWLVPTCPYCGKSHHHYGGPLNGDPYKYLEQVLFARCDKTDRRRLFPGHPDADLRYILQASLLS